MDARAGAPTVVPRGTAARQNAAGKERVAEFDEVVSCFGGGNDGLDTLPGDLANILGDMCQLRLRTMRNSYGWPSRVGSLDEEEVGKSRRREALVGVRKPVGAILAPEVSQVLAIGRC